MRTVAAAFLLALAAPAWAANYATCILDKVPAVQNDIAAQAAHVACTQQYPGGIQAVPQGDGCGITGYSSGAECTAKQAATTRSNRGAQLIGVACRKLYDDAPPGLKPFNGKLDGAQ